MGEKKITKAMNDANARAFAIEKLMTEGLENFTKIGNNSYAIDGVNAENKPTVVRVDIVVPKVEEGVTVADLESDYLDELEVKAENERVKAEAKAKKIARDSKKRAEDKANASNPVIVSTVISE